MVVVFEFGFQPLELIEQIAIHSDDVVWFHISAFGFVDGFFEGFAVLFGEHVEEVCDGGVISHFEFFFSGVPGYVLDVPEVFDLDLHILHHFVIIVQVEVIVSV